MIHTEPDPLALFDEWFKEAESSEPNDPNAMALAVIDAEGRPSVRMVLLKGHDARGFEFFTNYESRKGQGLAAHPDAELCFYWKTTRKQIRITGKVERVSAAESDIYYASRLRLSRIGAWASTQTRPMPDYETLQAAQAEAEKRFEGVEDIPRPSHWGGFRLTPDRIEFWQDQPFRLHKRFVYVKDGNGWKKEWLYP